MPNDTSVPAGNMFQRLHALLEYSPESGELRWKVNRRGSAKVGSLAGQLDEDSGYRRVRIDGRRYRAHRIVWIMVFGAPPVGVIDHINGKKDDNRINNLRDIPAAINNQNVQVARKTKRFTDLVGPTFQPKRGKWLVKITVEGKSVFIGRYDGIDEAKAAYDLAKSNLHSGYVAF